MSTLLYELAGRDAYRRFSPHCWKSHLALAHKGLNFETRPVRYYEIADTLSFADYALLPVLKDGDTSVTDSWDIASYLEEQYPQAPSLFSTAADKALAESINHWCDAVLSPLIRPLIILDIYHLLHEQDQPYFRQSREAKLGMTLEDVAQGADAALLALREELESVREVLAMRPYIGGETASYADICLLGTFLWISTVRDLQFVEPQDCVFDWYQRMLADYPAAKVALMK